MKVLLAAASFSSHISGLQRHAFNVVRCLLQLPEISTVHLVVAPWQRALVASAGFQGDARLATHVAGMDQGSFSRNLWYYRELPALAHRLHVDVVHLTYPMPIARAAFPCPTVVTLHDLYPYEIPLNFGFPKFLFNRLVLQQCLRNADAIACVSEITRLMLKRYAPAKASQKAVRIYNCIEADLSGVQVPTPELQGIPFLLCVAQHRRNKNIPLLLRTFARLLQQRHVDRDLQLVVIGISGPETAQIHGLLSRLQLEGRVHLMEGLSEQELQWCYAHCEALVVPSRTEGFGLPVAEALLAGCRVVCSDIPAFREVGGEHCRFVPLRGNVEAALAEAIVTSLHEPVTPPVVLPQFSAALLAQQYLGLYRRLIAMATVADASGFSASFRAASERQLP